MIAQAIRNMAVDAAKVAERFSSVPLSATYPVGDHRWLELAAELGASERALRFEQAAIVKAAYHMAVLAYLPSLRRHNDEHLEQLARAAIDHWVRLADAAARLGIKVENPL